MANTDRNEHTSQPSSQDLAKQLQSLLEESWSPEPVRPAEPMQRRDPTPPAASRLPEKETGASRKPQPRRRTEVRPRPAAGRVRPERKKPDQAPPAEKKSWLGYHGKQKEPTRTEAAQDSEQRPWAMLLLRDLAVTMAVLTLIFTFFLRLSQVDGPSMYPTLVDRDRILLMRPMPFDSPDRGDIVVARVPSFSADPIVKRIIAVEGDTVDIDFEAGTVSVNGQVLEEPYINAPTHREFGAQGTVFPLTVEKGHVFLMGDNRNDSYDSRYASIGQVDRRCILGRAALLLWPGWDYEKESLNLSRIGRID